MLDSKNPPVYNKLCICNDAAENGEGGGGEWGGVGWG